MKLTSLGFKPAFASTKFAITWVELPGAVIKQLDTLADSLKIAPLAGR